jgi:hypothetical protein
MVPVFVLMAGQTWTDLMYRMMDAEYKWSSLYFVVVILIMNFWILNLFVAVINEMFAKIRDESTNNSAFKSGGDNEKYVSVGGLFIYLFFYSSGYMYEITNTFNFI